MSHSSVMVIFYFEFKLRPFLEQLSLQVVILGGYVVPLNYEVLHLLVIVLHTHK